MNQKLGFLLSLLLLTAFSTRSYGVISLTIEEVGADLVLSASGGYNNVNGLTLGSTGSGATDTTLFPLGRTMYVTQSGSSNTQFYTGFSYVQQDPIFTGAAPSFTPADSSSISGASQIFVTFTSLGTSISAFALGYDFPSSTPITAMNYSGSATWNNTSFSDFGFTPGTFEISWDGGNEGLKITVVPEPSAYAAILAVAALGLVVLRRRR